jgi:uncharacterized membrane protein YeaQ/YmgE (transglycosylase-associated protein family)
MSILAWIVIGLLAGWLAARITRSPHGLLRNLAIGLLGAVLGGFVFSKLGIQAMPDFWGQLITATIGAVLLLFLWQAIRRA